MLKIKDGEAAFLIRGHEDGCPTAFGADMSECTCKVLRFVETKDTAYVGRVLNKHRAMCRKARRAADRAMRKAAGKTKAARATGAASKETSNAGKDCSTQEKKGGAA